jgi:hypothetical protein
MPFIGTCGISWVCCAAENAGLEASGQCQVRKARLETWIEF